MSSAVDTPAWPALNSACLRVSTECFGFVATCISHSSFPSPRICESEKQDLLADRFVAAPRRGGELVEQPAQERARSPAIAAGRARTPPSRAARRASVDLRRSRRTAAGRARCAAASGRRSPSRAARDARVLDSSIVRAPARARSVLTWPSQNTAFFFTSGFGSLRTTSSRMVFRLARPLLRHEEHRLLAQPRRARVTLGQHLLEDRHRVLGVHLHQRVERGERDLIVVVVAAPLMRWPCDPGSAQIARALAVAEPRQLALDATSAARRRRHCAGGSGKRGAAAQHRTA